MKYLLVRFRTCIVFAAAMVASCFHEAQGDEKVAEPGFQSLFDGKS